MRRYCGGILMVLAVGWAMSARDAARLFAESPSWGQGIWALILLLAGGYFVCWAHEYLLPQK